MLDGMGSTAPELTNQDGVVVERLTCGTRGFGDGSGRVVALFQENSKYRWCDAHEELEPFEVLLLVLEYFRRHRQKTALRRCQPVIICGRDVTSSDRNQRSITDDDHIIRPSTKLTGENHCGALHTVVQAISHRVPAFVGTGRSRKQNKKKINVQRETKKMQKETNRSQKCRYCLHGRYIAERKSRSTPSNPPHLPWLVQIWLGRPPSLSCAPSPLPLLKLSYCWGQSGSADGNEHTGNSLMVPLDSIWFFLLLFQRNKTGRGTRQRGTRFRSFLASHRCNRSTELCLSHRYLQKIIKKTFRLYTAESRRRSLGLQVVAGGATVACQTLCVFVNSSKTPVWIMTPY